MSHSAAFRTLIELIKQTWFSEINFTWNLGRITYK